jgi:hypothetical protein
MEDAMFMNAKFLRPSAVTLLSVFALNTLVGCSGGEQRSVAKSKQAIVTSDAMFGDQTDTGTMDPADTGTADPVDTGTPPDDAMFTPETCGDESVEIPDVDVPESLLSWTPDGDEEQSLITKGAKLLWKFIRGTFGLWGKFAEKFPRLAKLFKLTVGTGFTASTVWLGIEFAELEKEHEALKKEVELSKTINDNDKKLMLTAINANLKSIQKMKEIQGKIKEINDAIAKIDAQLAKPCVSPADKEKLQAKKEALIDKRDTLEEVGGIGAGSIEDVLKAMLAGEEDWVEK